MILREKVQLGVDGYRDDDGKWIPPVLHDYLAEVAPISAEEQVARGRESSAVSYRVTLPRLRTGHEITATTTIVWRGITFDVVGAPTLFTVAGRLHHLEVVVSAASG